MKQEDMILLQDLRSLTREQLKVVLSHLETNKAICEKMGHNPKSYDPVIAMTKKVIKGDPDATEVLTPEVVEQINKSHEEIKAGKFCGMEEIEADAKEREFADLAAKVRGKLAPEAVLYVMIQDVLPAEAHRLKTAGVDSLEQLITRIEEFPDLKDQATGLHARFPNIPIGAKA